MHHKLYNEKNKKVKNKVIKAVSSPMRSFIQPHTYSGQVLLGAGDSCGDGDIVANKQSPWLTELTLQGKTNNNT